MKRVALVLALVLAALAGAGATRQDARAEAAAPPPLKLYETCVTAPERRSVVRFTASDGTRLIGVAFGRGARGIVLAPQGSSGDLCSWVPYARTLARAGYHVLAIDHRGRGSSDFARSVALLHRVDLDVVAAAKALRRRGAARLVLGGASLGGTAVLGAAPQIKPAVQGVFTLGAPQTYVRVDAVSAIRRLTAPVLFVAAEDDTPFDDDARALHAAAAPRDKQLAIFPGAVHGAPQLREPAVRKRVDEWIAARF